MTAEQSPQGSGPRAKRDVAALVCGCLFAPLGAFAAGIAGMYIYGHYFVPPFDPAKPECGNILLPGFAFGALLGAPLGFSIGKALLLPFEPKPAPAKPD